MQTIKCFHIWKLVAIQKTFYVLAMTLMFSIFDHCMDCMISYNCMALLWKPCFQVWPFYGFGRTSARFIESKFVDHIPDVALLVRRSHNQTNSTHEKYRSYRSAYFNKMKDLMKSNRLTQCVTQILTICTLSSDKTQEPAFLKLCLQMVKPVIQKSKIGLSDKMIHSVFSPKKTKLKIHFDEF